MTELEGNSEIGAGPLSIDPTTAALDAKRADELQEDERLGAALARVEKAEKERDRANAALARVEELEADRNHQQQASVRPAERADRVGENYEKAMVYILELKEALKDVLCSLVAAHSLLSRGGKKAAPSDRMFEQMLMDYQKSIDSARAALANKYKADE